MDHRSVVFESLPTHGNHFKRSAKQVSLNFNFPQCHYSYDAVAQSPLSAAPAPAPRSPIFHIVSLLAPQIRSLSSWQVGVT